MKKISLLIVVCGLLYAGYFRGCGARGELVKQKLTERIDQMLGAIDVKRQEIDIAVNGLKGGIEGLRRAKIRAQVSGEQIQRRAKPQEERLAAIDSALKILRGHLAAGKPTEIAGRSYTPAELQDLANRVLGARKSCAEQMEGLHEAQKRLEKVATTLDRRQQDAENRLNQIEGQLAALDANRVALTALQQASEAVGNPDGTLVKNLDRLQENVTTLCGDVEVELRVQDEQWAADAAKSIDSIETTVAHIQGPPNTIAEIDKIIGK